MFPCKSLGGRGHCLHVEAVCEDSHLFLVALKEGSACTMRASFLSTIKHWKRCPCTSQSRRSRAGVWGDALSRVGVGLTRHPAGCLDTV